MAVRRVEADQDPTLEELQGIILRTIRVRRVTLGIFLVIALLLRFGAQFNFPLPLIFSPLMWGLITYPFEMLIKASQSKPTLNNIHFGFFILEVLILTYLIHILGGVAWIGVAYYLLTVVYANFFLPPGKAWFITGLAILLFGLMSYVEYLGLIPHWSLFDLGVKRYRNSFYVITTVLAGGLGIYATTAYTVQMFARVFREQNRSLRERENKLEKLWKRLLSAREEERGRIARQLHDDLGQRLMGIKLKLDVLNKTDPNEEVEEATELLEAAIEETRNLSHQLRPSLLDELGLIPALRRMADDFRDSTEIAVDVSVDVSSKIEDPDVKTVVYRAFQEILTNANKHGNADHIKVELQERGSSLILNVVDDGKGFKPEEVPKQSGLGLKGIQENVSIIGGKVKIESAIGEGTSVALEIPLGDQDS
ncbi:MAG: sensor histidine kinase [Candidatus Bipolaricaulota bacterium]